MRSTRAIALITFDAARFAGVFLRRMLKHPPPFRLRLKEGALPLNFTRRLRRFEAFSICFRTAHSYVVLLELIPSDVINAPLLPLRQLPA